MISVAGRVRGVILSWEARNGRASGQQNLGQYYKLGCALAALALAVSY